MEEKKQEMIVVNEQQQALFKPEGNMIFDSERFAALNQLAEIMASGVSTIPSHLAGNKGDCFAVAMQAMQWAMNPYAVAQKTHVVSGTLGYEGQLVNSVIYSMAPTKDRIKYDWFGPWENILGKFEWREGKNGNRYQVPGWKPADEAGLGVRVWATLKGEDTPRELSLLLVQATVRNSALWASDPKQQLAYLAVKRWTRLYCPEVLLGVYTPDELEEKEPINITPPEEQAKIKENGNKSDALLDKLKNGSKEPKAASAPAKISIDEIRQELGGISVEMLTQFMTSLPMDSGWHYTDLNDMSQQHRKALLNNLDVWKAKLNEYFDGGGK